MLIRGRNRDPAGSRGIWGQSRDPDDFFLRDPDTVEIGSSGSRSRWDWTFGIPIPSGFVIFFFPSRDPEDLKKSVPGSRKVIPDYGTVGIAIPIATPANEHIFLNTRQQ